MYRLYMYFKPFSATCHFLSELRDPMVGTITQHNFAHWTTSHPPMSSGPVHLLLIRNKCNTQLIIQCSTCSGRDGDSADFALINVAPIRRRDLHRHPSNLPFCCTVSYQELFSRQRPSPILATPSAQSASLVHQTSLVMRCTAVIHGTERVFHVESEWWGKIRQSIRRVSSL